MNKIFSDFAKTAALLNSRGWSEGFGGNISAIFNEDTLDISKYSKRELLNIKLKDNGPNKVILITGTGTRMYLVQDDPGEYVSIVLIENNTAYLINDVKPSGETESHIYAYIAAGDSFTAAIHTHPPYLTALSLLNKPDEIKGKLSSAHTEFDLIFPKGIGITDIIVPGSHELSLKTEQAIRAGFNAVLWKKHGMFSMGKDLFSAFDYIDVAEKCAQISIITG